MKHTILTLSISLLMLATACTHVDQTLGQEADSLTIQALDAWRGDHFGLFIHFGVYSAIGGVWKGEQIPFYGEQIMNHARIPIPAYEEMAKRFNPVDFDPDAIVRLAKEAGMKYIVITTKHHDGFCMFDTKTTDYNIVDYTSYGKDVVGLLAEACRRQGMKLGFYYSLPDWHYPYGIPRMEPDSSTKCWEHVNQVYSPLEQIPPRQEEYIIDQVRELLTNYGEITTIWFDMGLMTPEQSQRLRKTVKGLQPKCLINGRIMNNQGDYMTLPDNGNVASYGNIYWDNPASLYGTWGYKSWIQRPSVEKQVDVQLSRLLSTVSHGGVFLLNIGPDGTGKVIDYEQQVLRGIGQYLEDHPDTLDYLCRQYVEHPNTSAPLLAAGDGDIVLTPHNGLFHAAIDGTGYMSVEPHSWLSWRVSVSQGGDYEVFVIYNPDNNDKSYMLCANDTPQTLKQVLPGVDRMVQTAYMGSLTLNKGDNKIVFDQAQRSRPLEPLGLELKQIYLRRM